MVELWDVYDANKKKTGKIVERGKNQLVDGEYHIVVAGVIINSKKEILIGQRAPHKKLGLQWELNSGSIIAGETSLEGILRELKEEIGLEFSKEEAVFLYDVKREKSHDIKEVWGFKKDIDIKDIKFPDGETIAAKWVSVDKFIEMFNKGEIIQCVNFGKEDYKKALTCLGTC